MNTMKMNQQGIEATLAGVKSMTRRPITEIAGRRVEYAMAYNNSDGYFFVYFEAENEEKIKIRSKYKIGEVVEIETEQPITCSDSSEPELMWLRSGTKIKITGIKAEFLQDIAIEDVIKEGYNYPHGSGEGYYSYDAELHNIRSYEADEDIDKKSYNAFQWFENDIWNNLPYKAPNDWNSNPWVWVYEYEVIS